MSKVIVHIYENVVEYPDILEARFHPYYTGSFKEGTQLYAPLKDCYIDVILDEDQDAVGKSICSKCKNPIHLFSNYCEHCGAKTKGRRLLRKKITQSEIESLDMTE